MIEITLTDSNFGHQEYLTPFVKSKKIKWMRDGVRRRINVYTDNFIKKTHVDVPDDGNINVCLLLEPITNPPYTDIYDYIRTDFEKFDLVVTHNLDQLGDLIELRPDKFYYSRDCCTTTWLDESLMKLYPKSKMISMAFSNKTFTEGHQIRHEIYKKYEGTDKIDFYGTSVEHSKGEFRNCFVDYKYLVVCENTLQKGCNTEKLNDAFLTGCIPLYWGPKLLDKNYDSNSIFYFSPDKNKINFDFTESLENLDSLITKIIETDPYDSLLDSVRTNYTCALSKMNSEDNLYNILKEKNFL